MEYSYKFRLYPNREQEKIIVRTFGCCRYVFNHYLALRKETYEQTGTTMNYYACAKALTELKQQKETKWLRDVDVTALQSALRTLDDAYQYFFRRIQKGEKPGYPRFKSKRQQKQSYKSKCVGANIKVLDAAIRLPKLGKVKCRVSRSVRGRILSATVSRSASGKYYVSLCCRLDQDLPALPQTGNALGLVSGNQSFAVSSNGVEYPYPKYLLQSEKKLARLRRRLSRKTKGSGNWEKARIQVARQQEYVDNQRQDMFHKLSTELVRQNDVICIEDLITINGEQSHKRKKTRPSANWGEFRRLLACKTAWYGKQLVVVGWYPPNKSCPECGTSETGATKVLSEGLHQLA